MPSAVAPVWFCESTFHISKMKGGKEFKSCETSEECKDKKEKSRSWVWQQREEEVQEENLGFAAVPTKRIRWRRKMWDYREKKTDGQSEGFSTTNWKQRLFGRYKKKVEANEVFCAEWWDADIWTRSCREEKGRKRSPAGCHAADREVVSFPRPPIISRDFLFPTSRSVVPLFPQQKAREALKMSFPSKRTLLPRSGDWAWKASPPKSPTFPLMY